MPLSDWSVTTIVGHIFIHYNIILRWLVSGLKITLPFKDKELNKIAAVFNMATFMLTCAALVQPSWFRIKGLHCSQSLSLVQFFTFDDDDDDDDDQISIRQNTIFDPINKSDFNGKYFFNLYAFYNFKVKDSMKVHFGHKIKYLGL